jgi:hypothetical protein
MWSTASGDTVAEAPGEGTDEVQTTLASYTLAADLENLTGLGNVNQTLTGNASNNVITGGGGNDVIDGWAGSIRPAIPAGDDRTENGSGGWTVSMPAAPTRSSNVEIVDDSASGKTLLVGHGGYATIQAAIDASSDGDVIIVASGTWTETLNVNKDVTIQAPTITASPAPAFAARKPSSNGQITINAAGRDDRRRQAGRRRLGLGRQPRGRGQGGQFPLLNSVLAGTGDTAIVTFTGDRARHRRNLIQRLFDRHLCVGRQPPPARSTTTASRAIGGRSPASATASIPRARTSRSPTTCSTASMPAR